MKNKNELGIYIHIPFCVHKCIYCDFLSSPADEKTRKRYVKALIREINLAAEGKTNSCINKCNNESNNHGKDIVTSIFIGGGTPSVIDASDIKDIIEAVRHNYNVSDEAEITIECNPGTMDEKKAAIYRQAGINRISFGLQSTNNNELRMLGRIHTYEQFLESLRIAEEAGFDNINIDIMSALPGQTIESFKSVLNTAISLEMQHISVYSLIVEDGTALSENIDKYPQIPSDEEDRDMYHMTKEVLAVAGYEQYEISNYAKKGYECRHNIKYWERCNYIGFGIGAASLYDNIRYTNISDINRYMDILLNNENNKDYCCYEKNTRQSDDVWLLRMDVEELSKEDEMSEYMFLGLRKTKGIDVNDFKEKFGCDIYDVYDKQIKDNIAAGLLVKNGDYLYLSQRGIDISNTVMSDFIQV